ncbi:MAG: NfeD family protein [Planctomycetota bacterium]|nr:NfeD family protein [Planctomycetota bacterium]
MASRLRWFGVAAVAFVLVCTSGAADKPAVTTAISRTAPAGQVRIEGDRIITPDGWFARPKVERPALPAEITKAFVIPIHEAIGTSTHEAVKRKVIKCKSSGAQIVIFDMNTPGGRGDAMYGIVEQITDELKGVTTVAYVNRRAYSAGAVISLACNEIVMAPGAIIGDAMPIMISPQGQLVPIPKAERAKIESAVLAEVRLLAQKRGHSEILCQAMVTLDIEVWLIRNTRTRELKLVDAKLWRGKVTSEPGQDSSIFFEPQDMPWEYVRTVVGADKLATLTTAEVVMAGLASYVFDDIEALKKHYSITVEPTVLTDNWAENLVGFLTSPAVMGILMFIGILAIYAELHTPGFGVAGTIAIICFAIVFGSHYLIGLAQWWEIALFFVGLLLLAAEVFLIPGFGVAGVTGILCCVAALLALLVSNAPTELPWPDTEGAWDMFKTGVLWLMAAFVAATVAAAFLARYLPKVPVAGKIILAPAVSVEAPPVSESSPLTHIMPGDTGIVESPCRPVGRVRFGDDLVDATTEGLMIEAGARVRAVRYEGNRLIVENKEA